MEDARERHETAKRLLVKRYVPRPAVFVPAGDRDRLLLINILSRDAIYCMHACASFRDQDRGLGGGSRLRRYEEKLRHVSTQSLLRRL